MARWTGTARTTMIATADTEPRKADNPMSAAACDIAIGLRVHAYGPAVTRTSGGMSGFGVPRPTRAKRAKHQPRPMTPIAKRPRPSHGSGQGQAGIPSQRSTCKPAHGTPMYRSANKTAISDQATIRRATESRDTPGVFLALANMLAANCCARRSRTGTDADGLRIIGWSYNP